MMKRFCCTVFLLCVSLPHSAGHAETAIDVSKQIPEAIDAKLMRSTFMLRGPSRKDLGKTSFGTVFILGRSFPGGKRKRVLITAAHVFNDIQGETATILFRESSQEGQWTVSPVHLRIRDGTQPLWTSHPTEDVAAIYVDLPEAIKPKPTLEIEHLVDEERLEQLKLDPGDRLSCLGFPLGATANEAGFPILRSGVIASYPLLPAGTVRTFLFDFEVFGGNSGGPVYLSNQTRLVGSVVVGTDSGSIIGLVTEQAEVNRVDGQQRLALAKVVYANLIRETIDMLPTPPTENEPGRGP